jgi:putative transposase
MASSPYPRRKSTRYEGYDYRRPGAYFVTICATRGQSIFGKVVDGVMAQNPLGEIAHACWADLPAHYPFVTLDASVIMPNHMHGLLWLYSSRASAQGQGMDSFKPVDTEVRSSNGANRLEGSGRFGPPVVGSLSTIVSSYKAAVTRKARRAEFWGNFALWHGRFWDRIVRDDLELNNIRRYIAENPSRWAADQLHPDAPPNRFNQWTERP